MTSEKEELIQKIKNYDISYLSMKEEVMKDMSADELKLVFKECKKRNKEMEKNKSLMDVKKPLLIAGAVTGVLAIVFILFAWPMYKVWQQNKEGEAELARAEQNRQIAIQEARAKKESAKELADAEIIRAEGIAKANEIIGNSLQNNEAYIHYLWIEALRESSSDVIYIPTEAGIPITESTRFHKIHQSEK